MRVKDGIIVAPPSLDELLRTTPEWAKPVVVAALKVNQATLATRRKRWSSTPIDVLHQLEPGILPKMSPWVRSTHGRVSDAPSQLGVTPTLATQSWNSLLS